MKRFWKGLMTLALCMGVLAVMGMSQTVWAADPGSDRENAIPMMLDYLTMINTESAYQSKWFSFVPQETGYYEFYAKGDEGYAHAALYLGDAEEDLGIADDSGMEAFFDLFAELEAGKTYYLCVTSDSATGISYTVGVNKGTAHMPAGPDAPLAIGDDETMRIIFSQDGVKETWFVVTPEELGCYWVSGASTCTVYNSDMKQLDPLSEDTYPLHGGECYYFKVTPEEFQKPSAVIPFTMVRSPFDNSFSIECVTDPEDLIVEKGSSVTLSARGSCQYGSITTKWRDSLGGEIPGATGWEYTVENIMQSGTYTLVAEDEFGHTDFIDFMVIVSVDSTLQATAEVSERYVAVGSQSTLVVKAETEDPPLTYEWYEEDEDGDMILIAGATGNSYIMTASEGSNQYRCVVSDANDSVSVSFVVNGIDTGKAVSIRAGETKAVTVASKGVYAVLKFVPEITGNYKIYSTFAEGTYPDPMASLLDESLNRIESNDDDESSYNFLMEAELTAGKTYYILADVYDDYEETYSVTVENTDSAAVQEEARNQKAADDVAAAITSLKAASGLSLNDKAAVVAARNAYNKLTDAQKAKVPAATLKKLTDAEARIAALEKAAQEKAAQEKAAQEKAAQEKAAQVKKVTALKITADSNKIAAGKKVQLKLQVLPADAANQAVTWTSSNTKVATVDASGKVSVLKKTGGKSAVITATANDGSGVKATFPIKSMKGVVKKVKISGGKSVKAGKTLKLKATVTASKGANKKLIWTSSNTKYATVKNGKVKTTKAGKGKSVTITAKATDGSGKKAKVKIKITK